MKRVTGIGGIFFKAKDPDKMYEWYEKHLGLKQEHAGAGVMLPWRDIDKPDAVGMTVWSIFKQESKYFDPSSAPFMINYRVDDMDALLDTLRGEGVAIAKREDSGYGRFAWIMDPEGNRIELWEPPKE